MKDKFMKNGVFSLEYDKETLRDMVLELQEENQKLKAELQLYKGALKREHEAIHRSNDLEEVIDKAIEFTNKNWGTWCTHHLEYMTELQNILKEGKK